MGTNDKPLLRDPEVFPDESVLKEALGSAYVAFADLIDAFTGELGLSCEWRHYRDGGWLLKTTSKKKTICWGSAGVGFFRFAFYFTEKTRGGVDALAISAGVKETFVKQKPMGRLIPLVIEVADLQQVADVVEVARYKKATH